jgi:two-component SAPR family response regulator
MKAICVDDEAKTLQSTVDQCRALAQMDLVEGFTEALAALEWLKNNSVDIAFLDIDMPDMDGITLAARIKEIHPNTAIVFVTAYKQFAYDAMSVRPSGYLLKPLTPEALLEEVVYAMTKVLYRPMNKGHRIVVRTFGSFDVFIDGELLAFSRSKSKEVLAFLVDQQGRGVRRSEIYEALWEDEEYGHRQQKYLDVIIRSLRETLKQAGISQILEMKRGVLRVLPGTFDCDLYRFVQGDPVAVRAYKGKYMNGYSWAEFGDDRVGISAALAGRGRLE